MTKIFLDANILIDIFDSSRPFSTESSTLFTYLLDNISDYQLYTSCDLLTTIYYILKRKLKTKEILENIKLLNNIMSVIEFGNKEIDEAIILMQNDTNFSDLEDTIQFITARKEKCDYIISNDKGFYSHEIRLLSSKRALELIVKKKN